MTDVPLLRVAVADGPVLVISGSAGALALVVDALTDLADVAEEVRSGPIHVHQHIEYLGDDDRWRAADSFPLVISSDWPE